MSQGPGRQAPAQRAGLLEPQTRQPACQRSLLEAGGLVMRPHGRQPSRRRRRTSAGLSVRSSTPSVPASSASSMTRPEAASRAAASSVARGLCWYAATRFSAGMICGAGGGGQGGGVRGIGGLGGGVGWGGTMMTPRSVGCLPS